MPGFPGPPSVISTDQQAELRGFLMGNGTAYPFQRDQGIGGLGQPPRKTNDFPLAGAAGSDGGDDDDDVRILTLPLQITTGVMSTAMAALKLLLPVWDSDDDDLELRMRLAGWGEFYFVGRPRGLDPDLSQVTFGFIKVTARFDALDPVIHFV